MRAMVLLGLLVVSGPALAVRVYVPLPTLCARAPIVIVGEVTSIEGRWRAGDPGGIETVVDVSVSRVIRGQIGPSATVVVPGGTVGRVTETLSESPKLQADARYLLLLAPTVGGYALVGGVDGVVTIPWQGESESRVIAGLGDCRE